MQETESQPHCVPYPLRLIHFFNCKTFTSFHVFKTCETVQAPLPRPALPPEVSLRGHITGASQAPVRKSCRPALPSPRRLPALLTTCKVQFQAVGGVRPSTCEASRSARRTRGPTQRLVFKKRLLPSDTAAPKTLNKMKQNEGKSQKVGKKALLSKLSRVHQSMEMFLPLRLLNL